MLKAVAFAAFLGFAASAAAEAAAPADLLVGSVRDASGVAVAGATVRALAASGAPVGTDRSAADGTFAIALAAAASSLEVRCTYCRTERLALAGASNVVVVVQRYGALESDVPSPADLSALPYGGIADDLALVPFVVVTGAGANVSDRNLSSGRGLVADSGVPLVDYATGSSALADFPDRYVQTISIEGPENAYRYGGYASGGLFSLGPNAGPGSYGAVDAGGAPALALQPVLADVRAGLGESNDDGDLARRADLGITSSFAGGILDANVASASELFAQTPGLDTFARNADLAHVGYSTASPRFRTFADVSAAEVSLYDDGTEQSDYRSSYLSADLRIEHPAQITLAAGAAATLQTGYALEAAPLTGRAGDETLYVDARTGTERDGAYAGLAVSNVADRVSLGYGPMNLGQLALVPSFGGTIPIGTDGFYARAGYSQALRAPSLAESYAEQTAYGGAVDRDELAQTALGYDSGARLRAEAVAYREDDHQSSDVRQYGIGASLVWQVAPLISVRTWTLRAAPDDVTNYGSTTFPDASRQVLWASYANGDGIRFDAIAHRDVHALASGIGLDGDAYVPLTRDVAVDAGTARTFGPRHFYIGVRSR